MWIVLIIVLFIGCGILFTDHVDAAKKFGDALSQLDQTVPGTGVEKQDLSTMVGQIIKGALSIVGLAFFALMVYAGFLWMTARGNETDVEKAKTIMKEALIGIAVIVSAYGITNLVTTRLIAGEGRQRNVTVDPVGCCYDKVSSLTGSDLNLVQLLADAEIASRITTESDCRYRGETPEPGADTLVGAEGVAWKFYEGRDENWCTTNRGVVWE